MLTIQNIGKIVEKTIYIGGNTLAMAKVEDVYEWIDNQYEFRIHVETPSYNEVYRLFLNRNKTPYPQLIHNGWELTYEVRPNELIIEALSIGDLKDMKEVIRRIGNLMDRILNK